MKADLFLVDDRKAAQTARRLGITTIGTLGLLERAADQGLLDLRRTFDRIRRESGFFVTDELLNLVLDRHARRKNRPTEAR